MGLVKPAWPVLQRGNSLANGLVGGWPFYEGSGNTLNDLSGRGINATTHFGAGGANWAPGQFGWCWSQIANSGTQYIDTGVGLNQLINNGSATVAGTIAGWVYNKNAFNGGNAETIFDADDGGGNEFGLLHFSDNNLYVGFVQAGVGDERIVLAASAANWPQNTWVHYAVTWVVGGLTSFYVNGNLAGTHACTQATVTNARNLRFGYYYFRATSYNGNFDDVVALNRALLPVEIAQLYFDPFEIYRSRTRFAQFVSASAPPAACAPTLSLLGVGCGIQAARAMIRNRVVGRREIVTELLGVNGE